MASTSRRVPSSRDVRMRRFASSVQRWAMFSPARWMTASASRGSSQVVASTPSASRALAGSRETTVTSSPRCSSALTMRRPMRPVAPVTVTFTSGVRPSTTKGFVLWSSRAMTSGRRYVELLRVPRGVTHLVARRLGGALRLRLLGDGGGDGLGHVAVERRGDDVVLAQLLVAHDAGDAAGGGHLHLLGDLARAHVERAAEDAGEAEDVVDLVRVVRAAGGDDARVGLGLLGRDLRSRVRHREDHRVVVHA